MVESAEQRPKVLCISTYQKGQAFLREAARLGRAVTLLTVDQLTRGDWPRESLEGFHTMPEGLSAQHALVHVTRLMKGTKFERIVALDEFDLETAALAREHLGLPGMGGRRRGSFAISWRCVRGLGGPGSRCRSFVWWRIIMRCGSL